MTSKPNFPLSVPRSLWDEFAEEFTPAYADSWLFGAVLRAEYLTPRTLTGWHKLSEIQAKRLLQRLKLILVKPQPFPESGQPTAAEMLGLKRAAE